MVFDAYELAPEIRQDTVLSFNKHRKRVKSCQDFLPIFAATKTIRLSNIIAAQAYDQCFYRNVYQCYANHKQFSICGWLSVALCSPVYAAANPSLTSGFRIDVHLAKLICRLYRNSHHIG